MSRGPIKRVSGICYPRCQHCKAEIISSKQWLTEPCPQSEAWTSPNREHPGHDIYPTRSMRNWADFYDLEDLPRQNVEYSADFDE